MQKYSNHLDNQGHGYKHGPKVIRPKLAPALVQSGKGDQTYPEG